jgi:hypothetical protein
MSLEGKTPEEIRALAELSDDLLNKPKFAGRYQRLLKEANPDLSMPLIEAEDRVVGALKIRDDKIAALENQLQQKAAQDGTNTLYENLKEAGIVASRVAFSDLVKWASENGFQTTAQGLRMAKQQREIEAEAALPTPTHVGPESFQVAEGDLGKSFMKDHIGTARTEASKAMDEILKSRRTGRVAH